MNFYSALVRPLLFRLPAEAAHDVSLRLLGLLAALPLPSAAIPRREVECFGIRFPNPVGLAAGMDKNGVALTVWPRLGFGFVEIGTVTALPQPGNPSPRLFRLPAQRALINRLGFNNEGAERVAARLGHWRSTGRWPGCPVGINLGKSRVVSLEEAAPDYAASFRALREFGDYFVVNVSSPNTPGLRELQAASHLREILRAIARENPERRPVLVKLAPDLPDEQWAGIVAAGEEEGAAGWIATNTTLDHSAIPPGQNQEGGLSGEPLRVRATEVVRKLASLSSLPVIGVGGVSSAASAREKMAAGARLVQLYTGLVYEGPRLPARIVSGLD